ncbi:MAG: YceI family protein [Candidatus Eremiobacteraeota bacterium]|nr:YceI family protein [Candidatus Eremiobacteraeota bacterium]
MPDIATTAQTQTWAADPSHSEVSFVVRHMVVAKVRGHFERFTATFEIPEGSVIPTKVAADVDAASITTRIPDRDAHLRSADFFDVQNYPGLTFRSTKIDATGENTFEVTGDLSIRGTTKQVKLSAQGALAGKDPWGNHKLAYEATARINREDFGLTWNQALEAGGVLVGKEIDIEISIEAARAQ